MPSEVSDAEVEQVKKNFRRCREGTADAIIELRRTGDTALIPTIVRGIVWRYVQEETRRVLENATPETPLVSLGIDSLMMLEVVLDVQDALDVTIEDSDMRRMQTIGDVIEFLTQTYAQKNAAR
ncbi:MAG TPA: acyl carrier protein [Chthoniobacterales bacterium]|nr:acyl carrier protein [Chthoniobacterales bacterium]